MKTKQEAVEKARTLRKISTPAEKILWHHLRARKLKGYKFRRQHPIGPFVVDFYCHSASLIIEIDGLIHHYQKDDDIKREDLLESLGGRILRFTNQQVCENLQWVLNVISIHLDKKR